MTIGRPNWYYDHPPACTCQSCEGRKRRLRVRPIWYSKSRPSEGHPKSQPSGSWSPPPRRGSGCVGGIVKAVGVGIGLVILVAVCNDLMSRFSDEGYTVPRTGGSIPTVTSDVLTKDLKQHMLMLINRDRAVHGLNSIVLGFNEAPQRHAEDTLRYSYLSHWGRNGLKPYMRYTLEGGTGLTSENVSGLGCPLTPGGRYRTVDPTMDIEETQNGFMQSPGHRQSILDPWHTIVHLGIACNRLGCSVVQLFDRDYVSYSEIPSISDDGVLALEAKLADGFELSGIQVWYDEPPHPLTFGQLGAAHSYSVGQRAVASIRPPLGPGWRYEEDSFTRSLELPQDPYKIHRDTAPPVRVDRGDIEECVTPPNETTEIEVTVPAVTAKTWEVSDSGTYVSADVGSFIDTFGHGVYTILLWADHVSEERVPVSQYSIFVE